MLNPARELKSILHSGASWVHLDVMDGIFVPNYFLSPKIIADLRNGSPLFFDTHLMIERPERYIKDFAKAGSNAITVHLEACSDIPAAVTTIHACSCKAGIAINPGTAVSELVPYLPFIDIVLVMSIRPGVAGQQFISASLKKISDLQVLRHRNNYNYRISVDGGITQTTADAVKQSGADILVSGSSFFAQKNRKKFVRLLERPSAEA
jgi:ribulose-phosphate 3-epimerase